MRESEREGGREGGREGDGSYNAHHTQTLSCVSLVEYYVAKGWDYLVLGVGAVTGQMATPMSLSALWYYWTPLVCTFEYIHLL